MRRAGPRCVTTLTAATKAWTERVPRRASARSVRTSQRGSRSERCKFVVVVVGRRSSPPRGSSIPTAPLLSQLSNFPSSSSPSFVIGVCHRRRRRRRARAARTPQAPACVGAGQVFASVVPEPPPLPDASGDRSAVAAASRRQRRCDGRGSGDDGDDA